MYFYFLLVNILTSQDQQTVWMCSFHFSSALDSRWRLFTSGTRLLKRRKCLWRRPRPAWTRLSSAHRRGAGAEPWSTELAAGHRCAAEPPVRPEEGSQNLCCFLQLASCQDPDRRPPVTGGQPKRSKVKCYQGARERKRRNLHVVSQTAACCTH